MKTFFHTVPMKWLLPCVLVMLQLTASSQSPDLPPPPANIQSMPKGSYIIAMDTIFQRTATLPFNIKAYGLAVYLLNKKIKVKWIIKSGKLKDGIDFTVAADQVQPTLVTGGPVKDFKSGPLVIFTPDTNGVFALVNAYYAAFGLTGANRPNVYVSKGVVNVDVRYNLVAPRGAILIDGGNQAIHLGYMVAAGIPNLNYTTSAGDNLTNCFSFASEPHNTATGPAVDSAIVHIRKFVLLGGNFLAQCAAVSNYENNPLGRFQTTTGITVPNTNIGATLLYPNPDLSYSQFQGAFFAYDGASVVQNWMIAATGINSNHNLITGSGIYTNYIGASASKLKAGNGGMVYYIGCHDFLAVPQQLLTINGLRMYLNAFITPSTFTCPLPLSLISFSGALLNGKPQLRWVTAENETGDHFELQKSFDGRNFTTTAVIPTTQKEGLESYVYNEVNTILGNVYYRLKMVNKNGTYKYTQIVFLRIKDNGQAGKLVILENPVNNTVNFSYTAANNEEDVLNIYSLNGAKVYTKKISISKGPNTMSLTIDSKMSSGVYIVEVGNAKERSLAKLVKQ